jgi:uncharacterized protein (DUF2141 family)
MSPLLPRSALLSTLLLTSLAAYGEAPVTIVVDDVRVAEGSILVEVLASPEAFAGDAPALERLELEAQPPSIRFDLDLPPGTYALRILHDLDGDYAMTTNLVGMPAEPWAFSNNAAGRFGPPGWEAARFEVGTEPVSQTLQLVQ